MKKEILAAGCLLFSFMLPLRASAANFDKFYVFGDSLSDTGNTFSASGGLVDPTKAIPSNPPFFQGRFSNDLVWVDYVGEQLGLTPTLVTNISSATPPTQGVNYAFGGSNSGLDNSFIPGVPGVLAQVGLFTQGLQANNQKADPNALYAIWGGGNDYLFGNVTDANQIVKNLSDSVMLLAEAGAKNILVFNLPDLGKLPYASANGISGELSAESTSYNATLAETLGNLSSIPSVNIIPVDINSLFNRVIASPEEFGFKNVATPCVIGDLNSIRAGNFTKCSNPNDYLFFDAVHPTTNAEKLVAQTVLSSIQAKSVPEPSSALGVLILSALGAAGVLKRKQKVRS
ncbi:MAG: PEP-CTERM sorting domain-containing protein [Stigonema ocellatum SAG 48.90 = DSM 106950]|nr:PEP-CTERM sorting domain-containing protein [Stigonema ocellatum SAG 48.90 = DSM 106950]